MKKSVFRELHSNEEKPIKEIRIEEPIVVELEVPEEPIVEEIKEEEKKKNGRKRNI